MWLVDGQPEIVLPIAATPSQERYYAAVHVFDLGSKPIVGQPIVLLLSGGNFVPPPPLFTDRDAQRVVELMHFGSPAEVGEAIKRLKSVNVKSTAGSTLLHIAAEGGLASTAALLIQAGAKSSIRSDHGNRAITGAAQNGRREIVKLLTESNAGGTKAIDSEVVEGAIDSGHAEIVADLAALSPESITDLQLADFATTFDRQDMLEAALSRRGRAALARISAESVASLISRHSNRLLEVLVTNGVEGDAKTMTQIPLILLAAEAENETALAALLRGGAQPSTPNEKGTTALMVAAYHGLTRGVQLLLEAKADPAATDQGGATALHYAASAGHTAIVAKLLQQGARPNVRDGKGLTPLELALAAQAKGTVAALVAAGARLNLNQKNSNQMLGHALALDEVNLVERAIADGLAPTQAVFDTFSLSEVADAYQAKRTQAYLRGISSVGASAGFAVENQPDVLPKPKTGSRPPDPRSWDQPQPALSSKIAGIVDESGRFILPNLDGCDDPLVAHAILDCVSTWQFAPALKNGRPVKARLTLSVNFRARENRVFDVAEVEIPPSVKTKGKLLASVIKTVVRTSSSVPEIAYREGPGGQRIPYETIWNRSETSTEMRSGRGEFAAFTFIVEPDGRTSHATWIAGTDTAFQWAFPGLAEYRFEPGMRSGIPVRTRMTLVLQPDLE